jgi:uncharacterized membrane-anchored protein
MTEPLPPRCHVELHDELHARPALPVRTPGVVSYWTQWGIEAATAEQALTDLCQAHGQPPPAAGTRHHLLCCAGFDLKYERHGEFVSWQVNRALVQSQDSALGTLLGARASDALTPDFVRAIGGTPMLGAAHVVLLRADAHRSLSACRELLAAERRSPGQPAGNDDSEDSGDAAALLGSQIAGGNATVMTDFRLQADGFIRFVVLDHGQPPDQAARTAQRLCEIEAYRMLAMLAFPLAQAESAALASIERRLQQTVDAMANENGHDDNAAFDALTHLAAEVEHSAARTRYRFSATRAYRQLVDQRLTDLRETRIDGLQKLGGFFGRRFAPAMGLCASTDARLTDIADRINRAVSLARVRVEMHREANNQQLFQALAHRQKLQLRLQQTVEGLSVVAISYYAIGLVGYVAKSAKGLALPGGLSLQPDVVTGLAVLPVLLAVALFVRRLRRHFEAD